MDFHSQENMNYADSMFTLSMSGSLSLSQALEHAVLTFWKITTKLMAKVMTSCGIFSKCLGGGGVLLRYLDQTHSPLLLYSDELTFPQ